MPKEPKRRRVSERRKIAGSEISRAAIEITTIHALMRTLISSERESWMPSAAAMRSRAVMSYTGSAMNRYPTHGSVTM